MIAVIFEVFPDTIHKQKYFDLAAMLRPQLEKIQGFISVERFQSLSQPDKILSLSFWENEEAIKQWRDFEDHMKAQEKGRNPIFKSYRIRTATVVRDYEMKDKK